MNIVLIGLRGSGKSTVSKIISEKTGMKLIDTDREIEKNQKLKIGIIVETKGWEYFRNLEEKFIKTIKKKDNHVISAGGGIILNPKNREILQMNSVIIYLDFPPEICAQRISNDNNRPSLTLKKSLLEEMIQVRKERHQIYRDMANHTIKKMATPEEIAQMIINLSFS